MHVIVATKRPIAIGTFARSRGETFLDAVLAEDVTACFDDRILEVAAANRAKCKCLK